GGERGGERGHPDLRSLFFAYAVRKSAVQFSMLIQLLLVDCEWRAKNGYQIRSWGKGVSLELTIFFCASHNMDHILVENYATTTALCVIRSTLPHHSAWRGSPGNVWQRHRGNEGKRGQPGRGRFLERGARFGASVGVILGGNGDGLICVAILLAFISEKMTTHVPRISSADTTQPVPRH